MKSKFKKTKGLFLMAAVGRAAKIKSADIDADISALCSCGCDAIVVEIRDKKDLTNFPAVAACIRRQGLYVIVDGFFSNFDVDGMKITLPRKNWLKIFDECVCRRQPVFLTGNARQLKIAADILSARKQRIIAASLLPVSCADDFAYAGPAIHKAGLYMGFSDTTDSLVAPLLSIAWGARVIEKTVRLTGVTPIKRNSYTISEFRVLSGLLCDAREYVKRK